MKNLFLTLIFISFQGHGQNPWEFVTDMTPQESLESDFGMNMVFAGDKLIVAWPRVFTRGEDADSCGEIITYEKQNGEYNELSRLTAEDLTGSCVEGDGFGFGLAYEDGILAIGMPAGVRAGIGQSGGASDADSRVFITEYKNGNWNLIETLQASDLGNGKGMGGQLVMEDGLLLVHAHEYDSIFDVAFVVSTGVYVFENSGNGYQEVQKLEENFHLFGQDFDYENGQIIVGAWGEQLINQPGQVYIYEKSGDQWSQVQVISDDRNANLGNQIEIHENTLAAGNVQAGGIGGVTLFTKDTSGTWSESQFIQASDNQFNDQFGITVRLDDDELIVGATAGENPTQTLGAVYTFQKNDSGLFIEDQKLITQNPSNLYDRFGGNLIFNGTDLLINSVSGGFPGADVTSFHHFSRENSESSYTVNSKVSGSYASKTSEHQKISLEILEDGRAVLFASANNENENFWFLSVGEFNDSTIFFEDVYSTSGAMFGMEFQASDVIKTDIGTASLNFTTCNTVTLAYDFPEFDVAEVEFIKDLEIPGNECDDMTKDLPNGISGAWFDSSRSGEGFTVYLEGTGNTQTATVTWFTYDNQGNQFWVRGQGPVTDNQIKIENMSQFNGSNLFSGNSKTINIGSLNMSWNDCRQATVSYDFTSSDMGSGDFQLSQLTQLDETSCSISSK